MTGEKIERSDVQSGDVLPVLPLRDVVVYPHTVMPLFVGRERSINALQVAMGGSKKILLVAQKSATTDEPSEEDMFRMGTVAVILQLLKLPDGTVKVLVEGDHRASVLSFTDNADYFEAKVEPTSEVLGNQSEVQVLMRSVLGQFEQYVKLNKKIPPEIMSSLSGIEDASRLADTVAANISLKIEDKQEMLEQHDVLARLEGLMGFMEGEIDLMEVEKRIRGRVKRQMEKGQREYYLNEQMKAIQKELGDMDEAPNEIEEFAERIASSGMPKDALEKTTAELKKLKMMSQQSAEATVVRNYLDCMLGVPWKKRSRISHDLDKAEDILAADHYGLEKIKERILEYLAVQKRVKKLKGAILCLVGPPGVGKTSLGKSIARATNRKFIRMSLGGVRDEAEIRGHRRTYIGSMPGKIIQKLSKVERKNPLFLLDEIDKMSMDFRGDPASALLEVLDPEQNHTFNDHYLEVDYDLSEVMFVATANSMNMPPALLDRMEVINLSSYIEDEKIQIAQQYLVERNLTNAGLKEKEISISSTALRDIVRYYTREAGVRNLDREISKICRKVVREILQNDSLNSVTITPKNLGKYLGVQRHRFGVAEDYDQIGQVNGLAWTEVGGELLSIEVSVMEGKGKLIITGQLGDVMQESIQAAMSVVRSRSAALGIPANFYQEQDIHVHVPEGAIPKDGPSAGIGMCTALVSALTKIPVRADVAMTGEITLRGEVLPIGGLKEKLLAALRAGIKTVIISEENKRDLADMPKKITRNIDIKPVKWVDAVLELALQNPPKPLGSSDDESSEKVKKEDSDKEELVQRH